MVSEPRPRPQIAEVLQLARYWGAGQDWRKVDATLRGACRRPAFPAATLRAESLP